MQKMKLFGLSAVCALLVLCSCATTSNALPSQPVADVTCNLAWKPLDVFTNAGNATLTDTRTYSFGGRLSTASLIRFVIRNFFAFDYSGTLANDFSFGLVTITTGAYPANSINLAGSLAPIAEKLSYKKSDYEAYGNVTRTTTVSVLPGAVVRLYILNLDCPGLNLDLDPMVDAVTPLPGVTLSMTMLWKKSYLDNMTIPLIGASVTAGDFVWISIRKTLMTDFLLDPCVRFQHLLSTINSASSAGSPDLQMWSYVKSFATLSLTRLSTSLLWWDEAIQFCVGFLTSPHSPQANSNLWGVWTQWCNSLVTASST